MSIIDQQSVCYYITSLLLEASQKRNLFHQLHKLITVYQGALKHFCGLEKYDESVLYNDCNYIEELDTFTLSNFSKDTYHSFPINNDLLLKLQV